jgi:predicted Zn-dependent protease
MLPGKDLPEDIIRSVTNGIYAVNFGGGSVDITSGRFVFSATEAYLIENGKVTGTDSRSDAGRQRTGSHEPNFHGG